MHYDCTTLPVLLTLQYRERVISHAPCIQSRLEETDGLAHGRLDVKRLDVLPVLLEEGDEEVDAFWEIR